MNTDRNWLTSKVDLWSTSVPDSRQSERRCRGNQRSAFAQFIAEFRPALSNMLLATLEPYADIDSIVEETVNRIHLLQHKCDWHKTIRLRSVVESQLERVLSNHVLVMNVAARTKQFSMCWRDHLLSGGWQKLQQREKETGRPYYSVLRRRYDKPWLSNSLLIQDLSDVFSAAPCKQPFRVFLYRCEQRFARAVTSAVVETIHLPNSTVVRDEMASLDLGFHWERMVAEPVSRSVTNHGPKTDSL